jgi:hypothetical protein
LSGQSAEKIVIVNSETKPDIMANSVLAIKLAGNQTQVTLDLVGAAGVSLRSICVFATGNQPQFTLNNAVTLEQMVYIGRGNQSKGVVTVAEGASVGNLFGSLAGNAASLHMSGAGTYDCSNMILKNSKAELVCE